jgi:hypothetical protein
MGSKQADHRPGGTGNLEIIMNKTTFTYQAVRLNGVSGYIATRWVDRVHAGKQFGKTKKAAREAFDLD